MARPLFLTAVALGAAAAATQVAAQSMPQAVGDRYGPAPSSAPTAMPSGYAQAAAQIPAFSGRVLAWPGKVQPRAMVLPAAAVPMPAAGPAYAWRNSAAPVAYAGRNAVAPARQVPTVARSVGYASSPTPAWAAYRRPMSSGRTLAQGPNAPADLAGAPSGGWRPVFASAPAQPQTRDVAPRAAAPVTAGAAAAPAYSPTLAAARAAPPNRALAADRRYGYDPTQDHTVRVYSVARPFGLKPDPAPIPPQFFTATADLGADPPGPLPINHTTATARAAVVGGSSGEDGGSQ